jgi:hypothetical protein
VGGCHKSDLNYSFLKKKNFNFLILEFFFKFNLEKLKKIMVFFFFFENVVYSLMNSYSSKKMRGITILLHKEIVILIK